MKIFSVRFYKNNKVIGEVINDNLDKELKRIIKMSKKKGKKIRHSNFNKYVSKTRS